MSTRRSSDYGIVRSPVHIGSEACVGVTVTVLRGTRVVRDRLADYEATPKAMARSPTWPARRRIALDQARQTTDKTATEPALDES